MEKLLEFLKRLHKIAEQLLANKLEENIFSSLLGFSGYYLFNPSHPTPPPARWIMTMCLKDFNTGITHFIVEISPEPIFKDHLEKY